MSRLRLEDLLQHVLIETKFLTTTCEGENREAFFKNPERQRAFVRSLEIIGEATKKLPESFRDQHPQIDWRRIAGMRDRLIHDYVGVDYGIVWDTVNTDIPILEKQVEEILRDF